MAMCLLGPDSQCLAQIAPLPDAVIQAQTLTPEFVGLIQQYAADGSKNLGTDDAELVKQSRNVLIAPFKSQNVSVEFRQKYSEILMPKLAPLVDGPRDLNATNALRVAGELATTEAAELLGKTLSDKRPDAVRLFAAMECGRVFEILNPDHAKNAQPAVRPPELLSIIDKLGDRVLHEARSNVLDATVRALLAGARVNRDGFAGVRNKAVDVLCTQAAARAKAMANWAEAMEAMPALLRVQIFLRDAIGEANPQMALTPAQIKLDVAVHGQLIAWIADNLKQMEEGTSRQLPEQAIRVGENACVVGLEKLNEAYQSQKLADDFKKATPEGDREFFAKVLTLRQKLEGPPLNLGPFGK